MMHFITKTSLWAMQLVQIGITISPGKIGRFLVLGEGKQGQGEDNDEIWMPSLLPR